jgi:sarcosine oxidase
VVVIGAGVMGASAAWHLAKRGRSVLVIERYGEPGHRYGASHGATRNFNVAYAEPEYVEYALRARELWDELAEDAGEPLLDLVGLVNHGWEEPLDQIHATHRSLGVDSIFISAAEANRRWPGMRFRSRVLYIPEAGRVRADAALRAFTDGARRHGARVSFGERVETVQPQLDNVRITTDQREITASHVVVTAGAWSEKLLSALVPLPPLVVTQEQPAHFAAFDDTLEWPSFNHLPDPSEPADSYWYSETYGMQTPGEGIKVGWHGTGPRTDPDARTFAPEPTQLDALRRYVRQWFPGLDADRYEAISCTYTSTPSRRFLLDRYGHVVVGAGFSGSGFKFAPAVGQTLADLVDGAAAPPAFSADFHAATPRSIG